MKKSELLKARNQCLFLIDILDFESSYCSPTGGQKFEWLHVLYFCTYFIEQFSARLLMGFQEDARDQSASLTARLSLLKLEAEEDPLKKTIEKLKKLRNLQLELKQDCISLVRNTTPGPICKNDFWEQMMKIDITDQLLNDLHDLFNKLINLVD